MIAPDRIGHVVLKVRDLERSTRFYTEVMGFKLMKVQPKMAFFSSGRDHHDIAILEIAKDAPSPPPDAVGLFHVAFRLRDEAHLRAAYRELKALGVPIERTTDHGITKSIYIHDPDGNPIEIYCDRIPDLWRRGEIAVPLDLDGESA
jgi:catechol 2,3-dioxygenase